MPLFHTPTRILQSTLRAPSRRIAALARRRLSTVREINGPLTPETFQKEQVDISKPLVIRASPSASSPPNISISRWFSDANDKNDPYPRFSDYLNQHLSLLLPYELTLPSSSEYDSTPNDAIKRFTSWLSNHADKTYSLLSILLKQEISSSAPSSNVRFLRFHAPLALLSAGLEYNALSQDEPLTQLYIAQAAISDLPAPLQSDLATPSPLLCQLGGKGDIYGSSIWLGLEPTYTPWHRDPNPNLFIQLRRRKVLRIMPPNRGRNLFEQSMIQTKSAGRNWRIRGEEMMSGPERDVLFETVWGPARLDQNTHPSAASAMAEATLVPGDSLYLPKGWWHSVRACGPVPGALNASVNWWFR
ncbi:putative lysine-specific demethylase JMJD5 [Cladorrhinum samala]|uniref:Lysine-specific demethylase JMJD5 n=1 Tax=Cladorrhinum samala TaxID=585594 RepID=A0AAV9HCA7_9PEZI|nr:putative lysine-specific demethylase JMJD5 [Cladorrhinum samala]